MPDSKIIIEKDIRFSQSTIWNSQKNYYDKKGIEAWDEDVPFYITSNPFIARDYAKVIITFIQEWIQKNPSNRSEAFTILELGSGTGQFSFYVLKNLERLQKQLKLTDITIRYVMSDVTTTPFDFWEKHPALSRYITSGILDFSVFDLYKSHSLVLHLSKKVISPEKNKNPMIVIANYLFDSLATDVFTISNGQLQESLVTVEIKSKDYHKNKPLNFEKLKIKHSAKDIGKSYYHNEFDSILFDYEKTLLDTHFQFPIAGLQGLKNLQALSNHKLLLLSSDKGYASTDELDNCDYPELDFHGSFSVMVNYHAIAEYFKKLNGDYRIQSFRENMITGIFSSGFSIGEFPQLSLLTQEVVEGFSPTDYFLIYENVIKNHKKISVESLASYFNLSNWDPQLFDSVSDYFSDIIQKADPEIIVYLAENMPRIADHFYYLPTATDTLFNIAAFYQNIQYYDQAIPYYEQSLQYFGEDEVTLFNMAMCYYHLSHKTDALTLLKKAHNINNTEKDVIKWIKIIESDV